LPNKCGACFYFQMTSLRSDFAVLCDNVAANDRS
jgi:hypothetical protein